MASEDFTKLTMVNLGLGISREMWYLGDITILNKKITESAKVVKDLPRKKRRPPSDFGKNPLTELTIVEYTDKDWLTDVKDGQFKSALETIIERDADWLDFEAFQKMVLLPEEKEVPEEKEANVRVFYVPIDPQNLKFYTPDKKTINAKSIITLLIDDEVYQRDGEKGLKRKVLVLKDIFNIAGEGFRGAKFLFKKAMDIVISDYVKENPPVTQVATAPYSGKAGDGEYKSTLQNRMATFTRWGFNHIKSEPEYYGLQKFKSIPEYGIPVQTTQLGLDSKKVVWGLIDYNFENVTRVKVDGKTYKIGGKTFDNVIDALEYEKETVSLLSQSQKLKLENSSGLPKSAHNKQVTSTIRYLDWIRSVKHTKNSEGKFTNKLTKKKFLKAYNAFKKKPNVSNIEAFALDHYYKQWLYKQLKNDEKNFLFNRYVNYIFEIPLKQSYNEWLPNGEKLSAEKYEKYKEDVLYVSEEALELFKRYDNTTVANQLDTNETGNFLRENLERIQNAIQTMDNYDQDNNKQLDIGEFENLYQDLKFEKLLKIMPPKLTQGVYLL